MTTVFQNIVTHFPSKTLGILFKNLNSPSDPNIYVLFSGHVCQTDTINATFLTFQNKTVDAKILNINIWVDVGVAVIENSTDIDFPVTTVLLKDPVFTLNQPVTYFSNYQINNSAVLPITSNIRVPDYKYPQEMYNFFYPDSILLKEAQGVVGVSGSPVLDSNNNVIALVSKIVGSQASSAMNQPINLVSTKMSMVYNYLFDETRGIIPLFFRAYLNNPNVITNLNLLVLFRNSYNITLCHLGFLFRSYKDLTSKAKNNLSPAVNGIILNYRITGLNQSSYSLVNYLQKNDEEITYFRNLFDNTDILSDFYKNKSFVVLKNLTYIDSNNNSVTLDLGTQSIANYYVNGDPSKTVTIQYYVYGPSGQGGINMTFGPLKTLSVSPIEVKDGEDGTRYTSQLPRLFTSTASRVNEIIMVNLYNHHLNQTAYRFKYCALSFFRKTPKTIQKPTIVTPKSAILSSAKPEELANASDLIDLMRTAGSSELSIASRLSALQELGVQMGLDPGHDYFNNFKNDPDLFRTKSGPVVKPRNQAIYNERLESDMNDAMANVSEQLREGALKNNLGLSDELASKISAYWKGIRGGALAGDISDVGNLSELAGDLSHI